MEAHAASAAVLEDVRMTLARPGEGVTLIVCPDNGLHLRAFVRYATVLLPPGAHMVGHMVIRKDQSRVTFVGCTNYGVAPTDTPYAVEFIGWGTDALSDAAVITRWMDMSASARFR
jgi:hypothetical protein